MDPTRLSNNPPDFRNVSPRGPSNIQQQGHSLSGPASHHSSTSLPSIRQLHPYLPPTGMSQGTEGSGYTMAQLPFPSQGGSPQNTSHEDQVSMSQGSSFGRGGLEQESERDLQGPPKKKRRRQALSCTECKRRKIKCDRNQPCGPCTRRNEPNKCQWHIIEPVEKYVTRAEYDALRIRLENLERTVSRLGPPPAQSMPMYQMGAHGAMPMGGVPGEASTSYAGPSQGAVMYQPVMSPVYPQQMDTSPTQHRYTKSDDVQDQSSGRYPQTYADSTRSLSSPQTLQTSFPSQPSTMTRHHGKSPPSSITKASPLALSSITSPYNYTTERQSKNYLAQTLTLGERLRPTYLLQGDPENLTTPIYPQRKVHPVSPPRPIYI